jgi:hypothetical protein
MASNQVSHLPWDYPAVQRATGGVTPIHCENCGEFFASYELIKDGLAKNVTADDRAQVSGWVRDRWRRGELKIIVLLATIFAIRTPGRSTL